MNRWQWHLQRLLAALGIAGITGTIMLLAAGIIFFAVIQPDEREIGNLQQAIAQARNAPRTQPRVDQGQSLALFYDFFPPRARLAEQLRTIYRLASDRNLAIEQADYKLSRIPGTPLWRYQITFPLNTDYAILRHYLADVLQALPNVALEDLDIQRADSDAELLEEKIGLVLFLREART